MRRDRYPNRHTEECTGCGARRGERHDDCRGHLGSGIRNLDGARRHLRRRWNQGQPEPPVCRPGARFYVTARSDGGRTAWLIGPFASHVGAQAAVPRARRLLADRYPDDAQWASLGTASRPGTVPTTFGR